MIVANMLANSCDNFPHSDSFFTVALKSLPWLLDPFKCMEHFTSQYLLNVIFYILLYETHIYSHNWQALFELK